MTIFRNVCFHDMSVLRITNVTPHTATQVTTAAVQAISKLLFVKITFRSEKKNPKLIVRVIHPISFSATDYGIENLLIIKVQNDVYIKMGSNLQQDKRFLRRIFVPLTKTEVLKAGAQNMHVKSSFADEICTAIQCHAV
ncbi:hypothetical protein Tcan_00266 [Toxocara canis]|uniref:Uncharacterized protein n=1 Tax=Toxocara canis TaxID=6265 RepID=A0A0B2VM74_TOXCA|nr:hypothetical protein Tcan_00266 [Toxocara canis]